MASIHDRWREDVNGVLIGGDYIVGVLMYEDREQSKKIYANAECDLISEAKAIRDNILNDLGWLGKQVYPTENWWVKIYY